MWPPIFMTVFSVTPAAAVSRTLTGPDGAGPGLRIHEPM